MVPTDLFHGLVRTLELAGVAARHRLPLLLGHRILAQVERPGDPHPVLGLLRCKGHSCPSRANPCRTRPAGSSTSFMPMALRDLDRHAQVPGPACLVLFRLRFVEGGNRRGKDRRAGVSICRRDRQTGAAGTRGELRDRGGREVVGKAHRLGELIRPVRPGPQQTRRPKSWLRSPRLQ